jgi:hypothetical protein
MLQEGRFGGFEIRILIRRNGVWVGNEGRGKRMGKRGRESAVSVCEGAEVQVQVQVQVAERKSGCAGSGMG